MREGWASLRLGEVCSYDKTKYNGKLLPYVGLENIESNSGKYLGDFEPRSVKSSTFAFSSFHLLYGRLRPYLNKVLIPDFEGHCSTEIFPVLPNEKVIREYLFYWFIMDSTVDKIDSTWTGARMPRANMKEVINFQIPIPPLQEQKQIVAILDKAVAAIDQAKANIEKNIENATEFQISATNNLFNSINDSELLTVDDITDFITDYVSNGSFASLKENVNYKSEKDYAVLLRLTDHSKKFKNNFVYVDKHSFDFLKKSTVYPNDIILSNVGARLGTAFRAPDLGMPMTLGPNAMLIKAEKYGDYFFCWLQSAYGQKAIKSVVSGAGQPKFNKTQFKKIKVPIPKEESARNQLVNKINLAESEFKNLFKNYTKKLDSLEELKKSILQKAFAGELTENPITV